MKLTAVIYPNSETDWLVAECPEIGTASQGHTEEEALANLREATELYVESFPQAARGGVVGNCVLARGPITKDRRKAIQIVGSTWAQTRRRASRPL